MAGLEEQFGKDDPLCLQFNLACAFRLEIYEGECRKTQPKLIAYEVSKMFGSSEGEAYTPGTAEAHELIKNDRYADENTRVS